MIVHITSTVVYALLEEIHEMVRFGTDTPYAGSIIANKCVTWYNNTVPTSLRNAGIFVNENIEGVNFPCFIPTYNQCTGGLVISIQLSEMAEDVRSEPPDLL